jgi:hypothetical protein
MVRPPSWASRWVKKRFALSRLCWLTYKGPSANLGTSDTLYTAYINLGVSPSLLAEGGTANIKNYFGLSWAPSPAGTGLPGGYWYYDHGLGFLGALVDVRNANRDPDFFELLQAAINVGSYAKGGGSIGSTDYTIIQDSNLTPQIMQLGANIIDEANPTQYPTHLVYNIAASGSTAVYRSAYGVMDLPYLSSVANVRFIVSTPPPASIPTGSTPVWTGTQMAIGTPSKGLYSVANGTGAFIQVPCIWNMFDINGPTPVSGFAPTNLRIAVASNLVTLNGNLTPDGSGGWPDSTSSWNLNKYPLKVVPTCDYSGTSAATAPVGAQWSGSSSASYSGGNYTNNWTSEASTALDFSNVSALYREPTALMRQGFPPNSNLKIESGSSITGTNSRWTAGVPEMNGANPPNMQFIGFFGCTYPLQWTQPAASGTTGYYTYFTNELIAGTMPALGVTVRLEYQPPTSTMWIPYMEYNCNFQYTHDFVPLNELGTAASPFELIPNTGSPSTGSLWNDNRNGSPGGGLPGEMDVTDPRGQSWGFPVDVGSSGGTARSFIDGMVSGTGPATDELETQMPTNSSSSCEDSHSNGGEHGRIGVLRADRGRGVGAEADQQVLGPSRDAEHRLLCRPGRNGPPRGGRVCRGHGKQGGRYRSQ